MDGKQLKNSILQWAIQGKLVPQNPKDEPASKLLERIAESRNGDMSPWSEAIGSSKNSKKSLSTSLRGAKATKQSKALSSRIYREKGVWYEQVGTATPKDISDEIPFEIPENWAWCRLDNLGTFVRGNGIKRDETVSTGKPCVRYGEMYTTYRVKFSDIKSHTTSNIFDKCQKFHKDDILMALTGENKWDIALAAVYQGDQEVALGGDMCKFSPFESNSLYLVYLINSPYGIGYKRETSTGDIIVHTSVGKLGNFLIPLPPLAEQKRIVAKLEQVLPLAEEYGAAQEQLDKLNKELPEALKKSILQEAIQGKLVPQNPKDEPAQKILERIAAYRNESSLSLPKGTSSTSLRGAKTTKQSKNPPSRIYRENGVWYEQIGSATPKDISDEIPFEIPETWIWCRMGDIIEFVNGRAYKKEELLSKGKYKVLRVGNFFTNQSWYFSDLELPEDKYCYNGDLLYAWSASFGPQIWNGEKTIFHYHIWNLKYNTQYLYREYLYYFFLYDKNQIGASTTGSTMVHVSMEHMIPRLIPIPPLSEQKRIVKKIEELYKVIDSWH
ncbi:restriction endonuclease subunit S [Fibrobacter sp.]|uniref:restriction endonuclease subunit S n=1 Tax=Fibrobacter sp. TaxID=35828 RepID=UPI0025B8405D|nr:restriction endonuclease subunit S [Fibrobacter sp.]MBR4006568.1 restriction endonuclease subunit S [Fibrobacter sp.]